MPYIPKQHRKHLDPYVDPLGLKILTLGELDYCITRLCLAFLGPNARFDDYAKIEGVLALVSKEIYERRTKPYEQRKCAENGDVF